jgi:hypothetical protein
MTPQDPILAGDAFPPAPWRVKGQGLIILGHLPRRAARTLAERARGFAAPPLLGSIAGMALLSLTQTPIGPYHELVVAPGILWRDIPGVLISHALVDEPRAWLAGRSLWDLPRDPAQCVWDDRDVRMQDTHGAPLIAARWRVGKRRGRFFVPPLPMMTVRGPRRMIFTVRGTAEACWNARVALELPPESPFRHLAALVRGPHLALWLEGMSLRLGNAYDLI